MNKKLRAVIAVILAVITAASLFSVIASAGYFSEELPIVYVLGKVDVLYEDQDGDPNDQNNLTLYPVSIDDIDISVMGPILKSYGEAFSKEYLEATATEQDKLDAWDAYGNELYGLVGQIWAKIAMDENGDPRGNSGICWDWNKNYRDYHDGRIDLETYKERLYDEEEPILEEKQDVFGRYALYDYTFHYDWRRDMYSIAEQLNQYIDDVLEVTGKDKCVLISRCYGCNVVAAYLDEYGCDKVETNIIYCSTAAGSIVTSEMFSGNFQLSPEGMANYLDGFLFGEDQNLISSIIASNVELGPDSFDTIAGVVNKIYSRISHTMMPKTLITSFASMPGYWCMVEEAYYKDAKNFVFGDEQSGKYRKLVDKIDAYHYTVTNNAVDIFVDAHEKGMNYANITKYGTNLAPMIESYDYLADGIVEVPNASFGATAGLNSDRFDSAYLNNAIADGSIFYINDEATIDASTCVYPDYTWFAEGIDHFDFPESVDKLLIAISRFDGQMTVFDDPNFPQFTKYKGEGNLLTWAGGLYINNSRDATAALLKRLIGIFSKIFSILGSIFSRGN